MPDSPAHACLLYRRQPWARLWIMCLLMIVVALAEIVLSGNGEMDSLSLESMLAPIQGLQRRPMERPAFLILIVVTAIAFAVTLAIQSLILWKSRLLVDGTGIQYRSPLPRWLTMLDASWSFEWSDVSAVTVLPSILDTIPCSTMTIDGFPRRRRLHVYHWVDEEHRNETLNRALFNRRTKLEVVREALEAQSLIHCLRTLGIEVDVQMGRWPSSRGFDLGRSRHAVFSLVLFLAMAAYASIAYLLSDETAYQDEYLLSACSGAGVLIAIGFAVWLRRSEVPMFESVVIAVLVGAASAGVLLFAVSGLH